MLSGMRLRAFTLVELLLVIAIVSILAAVLFPVFSQAKESARKTTCLSNTKQLSLGVLMYAEDSDEVLPPTQNGDFVLWPDLVSSYVRNDNVRICLSDLSGATNSYGLNELIFVDCTDFLPSPPPQLPTETQLQTPSDTIMMGELGTLDDLVTPKENAYKLTVPDDDLNDQYDARPAARHFNRANLVFFDGHSKALRLAQFYTGQNPADTWFCVDSSDVDNCASN